MTDLHYGKKTATFNTSDFGDRLDAIGDRVAKIRKALTGYRFDRLRIFILGDVNDGSGIYATQPHHQAETNVEEQAEQLTDLLAPWLLRQKRLWRRVDVDAIPGNHGRADKFAHEAANWDIVSYKYLRQKLAGEVHVGINANGENKFIRKVGIRGHSYLLYHGHDIKSFGNIPWYGMTLRVARWNTTALSPFDVVCMGHFHTFGAWQQNRIQLMLNGTMITNDDWALQTLGWESANKWWMFGVSDKRPVTWQFGVEV